MAEAVRFELTVGYEPTTVFKTAALNRSATLPKVCKDIPRGLKARILPAS